MTILPGSVLFFCTMNAVRSPMAASLLRHKLGKRCYVSSAGIHDGERDFFAIRIMQEIGLDMSSHEPHAFSLIDESSYDLFITLSHEARAFVQSMAKTLAFDHEHWEVSDPTLAEGRDTERLDHYRKLREELEQCIDERFGSYQR